MSYRKGSVLYTERVLGPLVKSLSPRKAVVAAVDDLGDLPEFALVGELVEAVRLPEPAGDAAADRRLGGHFGLAFEVELQRRAGPSVVVPAGQLDRPAALVPLAVAGLGVAEALAALVRLA